MGEAPPLEGSSWVAGPENRVIKIVLHGLRGTIEVRGKTYNQEMPGFGPVLTDADIASLLSYVRRRFGGRPARRFRRRPSAGSARRIEGRTDYWTVDELIERAVSAGILSCVPSQTHFPSPLLCRRGNELRNTWSRSPASRFRPSM